MGMHGDEDLGHTVAGWTGTGIAVLGFTVAGTGLVWVSPALMATGGAVIALAVLVTWVLHLAGWGKASGPRPPAQQSWRVRDTVAAGGHPDCVGCRLAGRGRTRARTVTPTPAPAPAD
ncbi:HGxxPAAW family protein [Streptomyces sp. NPDC005805]|uniref:HGxxPAAW family protein n=1 Tax=Streptomyces sp. NPDC005805 TaxID=3157068 RepID=UPI0033CC76BD